MLSNRSLSDQVMEKIKKNHIKMHSRLLFIARQIGIKSVLIFISFVALFFINLFFFTIKKNDAWELLVFGKNGMWAFLEYFPYDFMLISLLLLAILGFFWKRFDVLYRYSFQKLLLLVTIFLFMGGLVFSFSGMNEKIQGKVAAGKWHFFKPFYSRFNQKDREGYGLDGEVVEVGENFLLVDIGTERVKVFWDQDTRLVNGDNFQEQQFVHAAGEWISDNEFKAWGLRTVLLDSDEKEGKGKGGNLHDSPRNHISK